MLSSLALALLVSLTVVAVVYGSSVFKRESSEAEIIPVPSGSTPGTLPSLTVAPTSPSVGVPGVSTLLDEATRARLKNATVVVRVSDALGLGGMGSGFFISEDGLIVTNHHVIAGAGLLPSGVSLRLHGWGADIDEVFCVADDPHLDLALLRAPSAKPQAVLALYRGPRVPETTPVAVIGHPQGELWSITTGAITGYRELNGRPFYGTDARIEPGNSGGPVTIRPTGEVIGVSDWKIRGSEQNYAIPVDVLAEFVQQRGQGPGKPCGKNTPRNGAP
ncbi:serine protease [Polyangium sp. 15x6]|uniref:S1C family serine protease n=1 Tax=Polyangium sp. 15x6 TaxID=3042687 RepID=UPI00249C1189|nr:serine protease [Polyangium sp. 15x6]MDI3291654.1 trypsin-like peptidase domain-containing protein [Polyangium sp. 15x6]